MIKFIVIITVHFDAIRTCAFTHIVAEALILQPINTPTATSKLQRLAYHICFQRIRKSRILELFFEVNLYTGTPGTIYGRVELLDFLKAAKIGFHSFHRSEEHTSELQSRQYLVCRLLLEKKKSR